MQLDPDFRELVESFNVHDVRYLVVGGDALDTRSLVVIGRDDPIGKVAADRPQRVDALDR